MAQLSNPAKWLPHYDPVVDGMSKMTPHLRRKLGDLGPAFPELRKKVDTADGEVHAVKSVQKYLREHRISGIQNQMAIVTALRADEVLTDRIYYCLHQLVAGNRGRPAWRASPPTPQRAATRPRSSRDAPAVLAARLARLISRRRPHVCRAGTTDLTDPFGPHNEYDSPRATSWKRKVGGQS
jgi:hypothetical protein